MKNIVLNSTMADVALLRISKLFGVVSRKRYKLRNFLGRPYKQNPYIVKISIPIGSTFAGAQLCRTMVFNGKATEQEALEWVSTYMSLPLEEMSFEEFGFRRPPPSFVVYGRECDFYLLSLSKVDEGHVRMFGDNELQPRV